MVIMGAGMPFKCCTRPQTQGPGRGAAIRMRDLLNPIQVLDATQRIGQLNLAWWCKQAGSPVL